MGDKKFYRDFQVQTVNNGFIVQVGCQKLVFKTLLELADMLRDYWKDPQGVEKEILSGGLNNGSVPLQAPLMTAQEAATFRQRESALAELGNVGWAGIAPDQSSGNVATYAR